MLYSDYFTRIEDFDNFKIAPYRQKIIGKIKNERQVNLFQDCFSNHVDFDNPNDLRLRLLKNNSDRYIERDMLSAYFINKLYEPSEIIQYNTNEKINFETFVDHITKISYTEFDQLNKFSLGSNRVRFLIGNVGEGKSSLLKKTISFIENNFTDDFYDIINIYINFEDLYHYKETPSPIKADFPIKFYEILKEKLLDKIDFGFERINYKINPNLALKELFREAKNNKMRFIIYIDNLDFYHYFYSRYAYFEEYFKEQAKVIEENIMWLYSYFTKKLLLGDTGLNIIFSVRSYVYEDIINLTNGKDTEINTTKAYKLGSIDESDVIYSRIELLKEVIELLKKEQNANELIEYLQNIIASLFYENSNSIAIDEESPIKQIYTIGQHGYRSLVHFFSSLNIAYTDIELIERFFHKQTSSLLLVYYLNTFKRYSQKQDHFPNLFLNDCMVMENREFHLAHQPHKHTYWLKYFILKLIVKKNKVKVKDILNRFCKVGKYDEHLVRHVIGSLETANEFRCIECDLSSSTTSINNKKLIATKRGNYLFKKTNNIENCLDIQYLQLVVEDPWLSIPNIVIDDFYDDNIDYSHLYTSGTYYIDKSIEHIFKKAKSILLFLKILESSYKIEIEKNKPELHSFLLEQNLIPNLNFTQEYIIKSVEGIIKSFKREQDLDKVKILNKYKVNLSNKEKSFKDFFNKYYQDLSDDSKVN